MTKEQLKADNERLGATVAALSELLEVIGGAGLPRHAPGQYESYAHQAEGRLRQVTELTRDIFKYAGSPMFVNVVLTTAETMRGYVGPLWYKPSEGAMPAPVIFDSERDCDAIHPVTSDHCHRSGEHTEHRDCYGETWTACCEHCIPGCGGQGHVTACQTPGCTSSALKLVAS